MRRHISIHECSRAVGILKAGKTQLHVEAKFHVSQNVIRIGMKLFFTERKLSKKTKIGTSKMYDSP